MTHTDEIVVIDPAAEDSTKAIALAERLHSLAGSRIGLIDNAKHMASEVLDEVQALLESRYRAASFIRYRKANASIPTPPDALASLAQSCDAIVHGVAD